MELKQTPNFVLWRPLLKVNEKKYTKVPYSPSNPQMKARTDDPSTWSDFAKAVIVAQDSGWTVGIGFVFTDADPYVGIDLDKCRDPATGSIEDWALEIIRKLNSYTEISPSGTGAKIIIRGTKPGPKCRKGNIEIYETGRFFTLTGQVLILDA